MSHTMNVEWLEDKKGDFDEFLAARDWRNAQAVIDSFWEAGFSHEAELLRRTYLRKQYEISPRNLRVKDENTMVECDWCLGTGQTECEIEDHYSVRECKKCEGRGEVSPEVNILKTPVMSVLRSQMEVIEKGL